MIGERKGKSIMYRVVSVDEDATARQMLRSSIDWEAMEMEFAGEASDSMEALSLLEKFHADILFVDIMMSSGNGIEFIHRVIQRYPGMGIIVLTDCRDFECARQCVSLSVADYLLKPVTPKEIYNALVKIRNDFNRRTAFDTVYETETAVPRSIGMEQITQYINENFTNAAINLTFVAKQFGFNASYLSRKFKQETGMSFVEYLMKCRMERAIELAQSNNKMFRTATEVGIPDPNYFGRCFKKFTGVSYSEYVAGHKQE